MRDIFITMIVLGMIPVTVLRPVAGVLIWTWLSLMSPHRLTWGFAYDYPFVQLIAMVTMASWALSSHRQTFPLTPITSLFVVFTLWLGVTTLFAFNPDDAVDRYIFVLKIFAMAYFIVLTVGSRAEIHALTWVVVLSVGFFAVKGGLFAAMTGANHRVYGPTGSFIEDNNQMALATIMVMPLMRYLQQNSASIWLRWGFLGALLCSLVSVFASHSRGALLGVAAMLTFLVLKSKQKVLFGGLMAVGFFGLLLVLPEHWHERMGTITTYEEDSSAVGRLEVWSLGIDIVMDRPITGGGFETYLHRPAYDLYAPEITMRSSHSIVFQVLGEHGFVGLLLFVMMGVATWTTGSWIERRVRGASELRWAQDLASAIKVSLVGYFVSGLFLNLAFFDLIYVVMAIMVCLARLVAKETAPALQPRRRSAMPAGPHPQPAE